MPSPSPPDLARASLRHLSAAAVTARIPLDRLGDGGLLEWLRQAPEAPLHVTLIIPDDTRPLPPGQLLPPLLSRLTTLNRPLNVHVLVGLGLHAPSGLDFTRDLAEALEPFRDTLAATWSFHDAAATERAGLPLNRHVMSRSRGGATDRVVTVGLVEPHQYAGFSGGYKGLSIGCGATSTIGRIHSLKLLRDEGVAIGNIDGNPFRDVLNATARADSAPTWAIALVPSPDGEGFVGLFEGEPLQTFREAALHARERLMVPVREPFDFALIGVPEVKALNFYQASRALTYLALHPSPCVRPGGALVIEATCPDGYGQGAGERSFQRTLARGAGALLRELSGASDPPEAPGGGAQRAYVLAKALDRFDCVLIGGPDLPEARQAGLRQLDHAEQLDLSGVGLVVADPFVATPYLDARERTHAP